MIRLITAALTLAAAIGFAEEPPLTILAAASLKEAMTEVGQLFEKETAQAVRFSFDGSGVLARQIEHGAPCDIFISASRSWMDALATPAFIDTSTRHTLLRNRLVVAQPAPHDVFIETPADLLRVDRVAMGDPATVPAGQYARQFLEKQGLWTQLQERLVFATNVRAALALVEHDEVGAALVFATDVRAVTSSPGVRTSLVIEESQHDPIIYEAAVVKDAPRRVAALKFFWFLETPDARAVFARYGFIAP
jgi:molybdate transport system substrate-binding protein